MTHNEQVMTSRPSSKKTDPCLPYTSTLGQTVTSIGRYTKERNLYAFIASVLSITAVKVAWTSEII